MIINCPLLIHILVCAALICPVLAAEPHRSRARRLTVPPRTLEPATLANSEYRGWDYLVSKLLADKVDPEQIARVYQNKKFPLFAFIPFSLEPKEPASIYAGFLREDKIKIALQFLKESRSTLHKAEKEYGVSRYVVASILLVETQLGRNVGTQQIIYRLSRIASVKDPRNLSFNLREQQKKNPRVTMQEIINRGTYLESTFYPEIPALLEIARRRSIDVLTVRGSFAGAFGLPQFLPSSYLKYAIDGNKDGAISLFDRVDAVYSTAHYLKNFGWRNELPWEEKRKVIWAYNRSDSYIDAVLKLADTLEQRDRAPLAKSRIRRK